jgi:hypothetical protein
LPILLAVGMQELKSSDTRLFVTLTVDVHAEFPDGTLDHIRRAVSENASALGFKTKVREQQFLPGVPQPLPSCRPIFS